jgi:hypothetical protein
MSSFFGRRCVERNTLSVLTFNGFSLSPLCHAISPPHALFWELYKRRWGIETASSHIHTLSRGQPLNYESHFRRAGIFDGFVLFAVCDLDSPALGVSAQNCRPWLA